MQNILLPLSVMIGVVLIVFFMMMNWKNTKGHEQFFLLIIENSQKIALNSWRALEQQKEIPQPKIIKLKKHRNKC